MEKIVGNVTSKSTNKVYPVKWDSNLKYVWIQAEGPGWYLVCEESRTAADALTCAQEYIDGQPGLF